MKIVLSQIEYLKKEIDNLRPLNSELERQNLVISYSNLAIKLSSKHLTTLKRRFREAKL